jgi:hypothetical protein
MKFTMAKEVSTCFKISKYNNEYHGKFEDLNGYTFEVVGPYGDVVSLINQLDRVAQAAALQHDVIYIVDRFDFHPQSIKIQLESRKFRPVGNLDNFADIGSIPKSAAEEMSSFAEAVDGKPVKNKPNYGRNAIRIIISIIVFCFSINVLSEKMEDIFALIISFFIALFILPKKIRDTILYAFSKK